MMAGLPVSQQVVVLLDLAKGAPLSAFAMSEQIKALGGDTTTADINTRMHQMKTAGQARKEGDGWVLVDAQPLANLRAKWARDRVPMPVITTPPPVPQKTPTLRERIVQALRDQPGITAKDLAAHLGDLSDNEPASSLNILTKQQRVRHEGEWPARRYFACDDSERLVLPRAAKRKKSAAESGLAKPADAGADCAEAGADPAQLADRIEQWLLEDAGWCSSWTIASALAGATGLSMDTVAMALQRLVDDRRVVWRFVSELRKVKQYAHPSVIAQEASTGAVEVEQAGALQDPEDTATRPHPSSRHCMCAECAPSFEPTPPADEPAAGSVHTGPLTDIHGPIANEGLRELAARDAAAFLTQAATAYSDLARDMDQLDKAIGANPATLPGYARCIALDLEDAIGRACDQRADHAAIKALSVALGSTWRAITQLSPGA